MADSEEAILKDAKKLPLEDRLAHKHWKARVQALEDIAVVCDKASDPKDPKLKEYGMQVLYFVKNASQERIFWLPSILVVG